MTIRAKRLVALDKRLTDATLYKYDRMRAFVHWPESQKEVVYEYEVANGRFPPCCPAVIKAALVKRDER